MRFKLLLLLALSCLVLNCGGNEAKSAEKRILSQINEISEDSRRRINSTESRESLIRLNELRKGFPADRDEIEREAKLIRSVFSDAIEDNRKTGVKWEELNTLPLSENYRNCVEAQVRSMAALTARLELAIEEMDLLLDRRIGDAESLEEFLKLLRIKQESAESRTQQVEAELADHCRRPS